MKTTEMMAQVRAFEKEKNISLLYVCESGSRAWGFPSPDSDYDVRFIYKHPKDWYLSLRKRKDTIEYMPDKVRDYNGWELRKALTLLRKSNAGLLGWLYSPIVYWMNDAFLCGMQELAKDCYSPIAVMHHFLSMNRKYTAGCEEGDAKLKHYFYALRTAFLCKWIAEKKEVPPVRFTDTWEAIGDAVVLDHVRELMELKKQKEESYIYAGNQLVLDFLRDNIAYCEARTPQLPAGKADLDKMDVFFRGVINDEY